MAAAQAALDEKYRSYEEMAGWSASRFHPAGLQGGVQTVPVAEAGVS
jgi:pyruvate-ferredoxin/flavodoxin oxidoreductase